MRASNWGQYPRSCWTWDRLVTTLCPPTDASPPVTLTAPVSMLNVEVLPAPFIPSSPKHSPWNEWRSRKYDATLLQGKITNMSLVRCIESVVKWRFQTFFTPKVILETAICEYLAVDLRLNQSINHSTEYVVYCFASPKIFKTQCKCTNR